MIKAKPKRQSFSFHTFLLAICLLLTLSDSLEIGQSNHIKLDLQNKFQCNETITISEAKIQEFIKESNLSTTQKWFIFVDVEPSSEVTWPDIYVKIFTKNTTDNTKVKLIKECEKQGLQLETCYVSSDQLNYKEQELIIQVATDEESSLLLETEIVSMKKLQLNSCHKIDSSSMSKKDAKLFKINVSQIAVPYEQIRVTLTPINKIYSGQALNIYATMGKFFPTPYIFDGRAYYAWEMGVSIMFTKWQLSETGDIYLLLDYPENYMFDLDVTLIEDYKKVIELKTGEFYDDLISYQNKERTYAFSIAHPELNNYIRIKKYFGIVGVQQTKVIDYAQGFEPKLNMTYLTEFNYDAYLDSRKFKIQKGIKKLQLKLSVQGRSEGAIYTIQTYENSKDYNWINQGQTHLSQLLENQKTYFLSRVIRHKSVDLALSEAQIKIVAKQGAISERIFVCLIEDIDKCSETVKNHTSEASPINVQGVVSELGNVKKPLDKTAEIKKISLEFEKDKFINYTEQYKQQIILIEVTGEKQFNKNVFSIEFINVGIMDTISQHESKQQIIDQEEFKLYRFTMPNDTNIKSLVFHVTILYGFVERFITVDDPAGKTQQDLQVMMISQPPHFYRMYENSIEAQSVQPLKTYYLVIFARHKSMFRVKVQLKKTMSHPADMRNLTYSFVYLSTLTSSEYVFEPGQLIIFDLSKTGLTHTLIKGYAPLPLDGCVIARPVPDPKAIPIEPYCTDRQKIGKSFGTNLDIREIGQKFSVYNGNNQTVPLTLSFQNIERCGNRPIGEKQFFHARIFKDHNITQICIYYHLYKKGPLLVSVKSMSPTFRKSLKYLFSIGKGDMRHLSKEQTIFQPEDLQEGCKGMFDDCYGKLIVKLSEDSEALIQNLTNEQFVFEVQYVDEPIDLIDGISFVYAGAVSNQAPIHFKYGLYNVKQAVSIVLENQRGYFTILAKLIPTQDRYIYPTFKQKQEQSNSTSSKNQSAIFQPQPTIYQTDNERFFLYDTLRIPQQDLAKQCNPKDIAYWRACTLLISVYPLKQLSRYLVDGKFNIEVVQHTSVLKEHQVTPGYVEPGMMNFYEIQNTIQNSTIMLYINTNTVTQKKDPFYCLEPYARFGIDEKATSSNNQQSFEKGSSQLIIPKAEKGTYSLTIKGLETHQKYCEYTLQYSVIPPSENGQAIVPIKTLKKSTPSSLVMSLEQGSKTQFFLFFNDAHKTNFKILTLFEKLGEVLISVMPLPNDKMQQEIMTNIPTIDALFKADWKDSNSLEIKAEDKAYCSDCMYLIKVECIKEMEGKVIIPEEGSEIAVKSNSMLYDQMVKGEKSLYRIYTESHLAFKLNLISGEINLKVKSKRRKQIQFEKNYTSGEEKIELVQLKKEEAYDYLRYEIIEVECIKDTHFLFGFLKDYNMSKQNSSQTPKPNDQAKYIEEWINKPLLLTYGVPRTVFIIPDYQQCVTGIMEADPVFIISVSPFLSHSVSIDQLEFQFRVDFPLNKTNVIIPMKNLNVEKTSKSKVVRIIDTDIIKNYAQGAFVICFKNPQKISIDVIQSSHLNYLSPNTQILVRESMNLTFMANDDNIIEVNECSGRSLISISKDFGSVHSLESQITQIRKANSLIEFKRKGPVYLSAETSGLMSLNWRDVDYETGKNLGYFMYEPSSFRIVPSSDQKNQLTLKISALKEVDSLKNVLKEKRPTIDSLVLEVYVEKQQQELYEAMNCHKEGGLKLTKKMNFNLSAIQDQSYTVQFYVDFDQQKGQQQITNKFASSNYVLIAVKAILEMKNQVTGEKQHYRFFYPYQELILVSQQLQEVSSEQTADGTSLTSLEISLVVVGSLVILGTFVVLNCKSVKKFIRKLRGKDRLPDENHFQLRSEIASQLGSYYRKALD